MIVIVIIGILVAVTVVSYSGISHRAEVCGLQTELSNNSKQIKLYQVEHDTYPSSFDINHCPSAPIADTKYCLGISENNTMEYEGSNDTFLLTETTSNSVSYSIDESGVITENTDTIYSYNDTWTIPSTTYTQDDLSVAKKSNGKIILVNVSSDVIYESEVANTDALVAADNSASSWSSAGITTYGPTSTMVWNLDGGLYMTVSDMGVNATTNATVKIYKSTSGNGGDWTLFSTIQDYPWTASTTYSYNATANLTGSITKLSSGRLVIFTGRYFVNSNFLMQSSSVYISDDNGLTWTSIYTPYTGASGVLYAEHQGHIVEIGSNIYTSITNTYVTPKLYIIKSTDGGDSFSATQVDTDTAFGFNVPASDVFLYNGKLGIFIRPYSSRSRYLYYFNDVSSSLTDVTLIHQLSDLPVSLSNYMMGVHPIDEDFIVRDSQYVTYMEAQ